MGKTKPALLLSGGVFGLICGLWAGSSPTLAWMSSADGQRAEAMYQGQPTSSWIGRLQDRSPNFRQQAVQALEHIGPKEPGVVSTLAAMLHDPSVGVRIASAFALRRLRP